MNADCENRTKSGDCLTRDSRRLCDSCCDLLSDDEHTQREIAFMVADYARKAQRQLAQIKRPPRRCLTLRPNERRSCIGRNLVALCGYCITSMTTHELIAYATAIVTQRNESAAYWKDEAEAADYAEELRARGVTGVHWNIELTTQDDYPERAYLICGLFMFGTPCFIHAEQAA